MILNSPYNYNQQLCLRLCFQSIIIDHCNCTDPRVVSLFNSSGCDSFEEIQCKNEVQETILFEDDNYSLVKKRGNLKDCLPFCPLECNATEFKSTISTNKIIADLFLKYIRENKNLSKDFTTKNLTLQVAEESVAKVNIFYESMSYVILIDSPKMDWVSLLAYIGGILGLFLGISVFSFFEIFIFILEVFYNSYKNKKISVNAKDTFLLKENKF